jgi:hypothetical protein
LELQTAPQGAVLLFGPGLEHFPEKWTPVSRLREALAGPVILP